MPPSASLRCNVPLSGIFITTPTVSYNRIITIMIIPISLKKHLLSRLPALCLLQFIKCSTTSDSAETPTPTVTRTHSVTYSVQEPLPVRDNRSLLPAAVWIQLPSEASVSSLWHLPGPSAHPPIPRFLPPLTSALSGQNRPLNVISITSQWQVCKHTVIIQRWRQVPFTWQWLKQKIWFHNLL